MAQNNPFDTTALLRFNESFDSTNEDSALQTRGEFLKAFPLERLKNLEIDDYVIGHGTPTFCARVEVKTRAWAAIQGATAMKFGIYYGQTKKDSTQTYRFGKKFGETKDAAFAEVKKALLQLVHEGGQDKPDFAAINGNPLSQMFKAKILSLYFPDRFLNVCSKEHLALLAGDLGIPERKYSSEYQHLLLELKIANAVSCDWSNPKFMQYLYEKYVWADKSSTVELHKPRKRGHQKVNFEDIQAAWDAIGKASEEFALKWEKERLLGAGLDDQIPKIDDRRDRPGYGYDFLSYSSRTTERYIEVKSVGRFRAKGEYRFFLSENEQCVSKSQQHSDEYYFYLVLFDGDGKPSSLLAMKANDVYKVAEVVPASYMVRFDLDKIKLGL